MGNITIIVSGQCIRKCLTSMNTNYIITAFEDSIQHEQGNHQSKEFVINIGN